LWFNRFGIVSSADISVERPAKFDLVIRLTIAGRSA
jgi:hypothetical protein